MPRISHLAAAVVLGLAANAAQAQQFSNVIVFGDSLSDAGNYVGVIPGAQGSFTTNPDDVAVQLIADYYGIDLTASTMFNNGGWDFAWGGAQITHPFCVGGQNGLPAPPCRSLTSQIDAYFARTTGGQADPNALYSVWGGANDLFFNLALAQNGVITSAQVQTNLINSATAEIGQIARLQAAGANYIIVYNLPDIGATPFGVSSGAGGTITGLTLLYNSALNAGLGQLGDGIIPVDTYNLIKEITADYQAYGFTNVTSTACDPALMAPQTGGSSLFCAPPFYREPGANESYLYADGVHPTGYAHFILAQAVVAEIAAPGQVSMLGEMALKAGEDHDDYVRTQVFRARDSSRADDSIRGFANVAITKADYASNGWAPDSDLRQVTLTGGFDYRATESWRWGGAVSFTNQKIDIGSADVDGTALNASLYTVWDFARGYIGASAMIGNDSFDIERHILLGTFDRIETGGTDAARKGLALRGGLVWGDDDFQHGPFADVTWQQVEVDGFAEDSGDSTSMHFDEYDRDSLVYRVGYQAEAKSGSLRPFGRVTYNVENEEDQVFVRAGLNTMNGNFVMPGFQPTDNWWTAEIGLGWEFGEDKVAYVSYAGLFADDIQDKNTLNIGIQMDFGGNDVVVEPEPVVETAPDCSALDDDGDGVNNCNDSCPGTPAGQAIGPDGCPAAVEAVEPPKEFRNP
jgi:outer membrane lipase/esterase